MPSISNADTPDPWMLKYNNKYLLTFTASGGDHIELWSSPLLEDFHIATRRDIWYNSHSGSNNRRPADSGSTRLVDIWAPEIHIINDSWWIYFAGAHQFPDDPKGEKQNASHRMYVLRGPPSSVDPMEPSSTFTFAGPVLGLPDKWAIDGTMFYINNDLYFSYSGWPQDATNDLKQELYIAKMRDPINATDVNPISSPQFEWESFQDSNNGRLHQINEGPAWLDIGTFKGIVFSAGASWKKDYQLGVLQYMGGNPLDKTSWNKFSTQLLRNNTSGEGPYGPGHCSYHPLCCTDIDLFLLQMDVKLGWYTTQLQVPMTVGANARDDAS
jgi:GH43 family beta-xylosidase